MSICTINFNQKVMVKQLFTLKKTRQEVMEIALFTLKWYLTENQPQLVLENIFQKSVGNNPIISENYFDGIKKKH